MRISSSAFKLWFLVLLATPTAVLAQTNSPGQQPRPDADGVYYLTSLDVKKLDSSPKVEFPRELAAYEITEQVVIAVTLTPDGKVKKTKVVSGKSDTLKDVAEKTVKKWAFQPYLVNGTPVPVRTEVTFNFENTLDRYREDNGDLPVHLDEKASRALVLKKVTPQYPPDARLGRIQGQVELRVIVGEDGRVHALHIIRGHPMLAPAAYNGVRQWEFKPYSQDGKVLPVDTVITISFTLSG